MRRYRQAEAFLSAIMVLGKQREGMGLRELLSPKVDFVFKRIFGAEDNQDVLISFLNAVFEDAGQPLVASVEILNPFLEKDALSDKMSVLDVKARTESGMLVDVEIQLRDPAGYGEAERCFTPDSALSYMVVLIFCV